MTFSVAAPQFRLVSDVSESRRDPSPQRETVTPISEPVVCGLVAAFDAVCIFGAGQLTAWISGVNMSALGYLVASVSLLGTILAMVLWSCGKTYRFEALVDGKRSAMVVIKTVLLMIVLQFGLTVAIGHLHGAHVLWLMLWPLVGIPVLSAGRLIVGRVISRWAEEGRLSERVAIVGATRVAQRLLENLESDATKKKKTGRVQVVGTFDDLSSRGSERKRNTNRTLDDLIQLIRANAIDTVIVAIPLSNEQRISHVIERLRDTPVDVRLCPDTAGLRFGQFTVSTLGQHSLLNVMQRPLCHWRRVAKDIEDRVLGCIILAMIAPLMAVIAVLIKLDSPGPVLFRQKRLGYNNQLIEVLKFRTMHHAMQDPNAEQLTRRNDPRVTRLGSFLRRTSLDELPQFINVIRGDMSIVGPRPHALSAKAGSVVYHDAIKSYDARHRMKPGITGWAQVNGWRGETQTVEQLVHRVEHDLFYVENWTIAMDIKIIFKTIFCGFTGKSAY